MSDRDMIDEKHLRVARIVRSIFDIQLTLRFDLGTFTRSKIVQMPT
jgi:hypothetical protein